MSTYDMIMGEQNPWGTALFLLLDLHSEEYPVGRFRDVGLMRDDDGAQRIVLVTRNGGGNRERSGAIFDAIRKHPEYIRDYDDEREATYAMIEFTVPEQWLPLTACLFDNGHYWFEHPMDKLWRIIGDLQADKDTPEVRAATERAKPMIAQVVEAMKSGESTTIAVVDEDFEGVLTDEDE